MCVEARRSSSERRDKLFVPAPGRRRALPKPPVLGDEVTPPPPRVNEGNLSKIAESMLCQVCPRGNSTSISLRARFPAATQRASGRPIEVRCFERRTTCLTLSSILSWCQLSNRSLAADGMSNRFLWSTLRAITREHPLPMAVSDGRYCSSGKWLMFKGWNGSFSAPTRFRSCAACTYVRQEPLPAGPMSANVLASFSAVI
mmetsp:Transcript_3390/g.6700  ORF Transcript_3390/g.6700 Transcript_3390/m.6700 type:complete len:201 (+) Transcript_3390:5082-5684(+)